VRGCDAAMLIVALEMAVMAAAFVLEAMAGPQEREERRRLVFISPSLRSLASQLLLPAFHVQFSSRQNSNDRMSGECCACGCHWGDDCCSRRRGCVVDSQQAFCHFSFRIFIHGSYIYE
jgi:hypothetical protein